MKPLYCTEEEEYLEWLSGRLRAARKARNLTLEQASKLSGVGLNTIHYYEKAVIRRPSLLPIVNLAAVYQLSLNALLNPDHMKKGNYYERNKNSP